MLFLFCKSPLVNEFDAMYQVEVSAVVQAGGDTCWIDFEKLLAGDFVGAVKNVPTCSPRVTAVYRGWMMPPAIYRSFYEALLEKGVELITPPSLYKFAHYLPENYPIIADITPKTIWVDANASIDEIMAALAIFSGAPVVLKDYVKSQKHLWETACFIPDSSDKSVVSRVVSEFRTWQGEIEGGLVFREYVNLELVGNHPVSGMPLTKEFRLFVKDSKPVISGRYWDSALYNADMPSDWLEKILVRVNCPFWTIDIAQCTDGEWIVIEIGDGQVSGLLDTIDPVDFYSSLIHFTTNQSA